MTDSNMQTLIGASDTLKAEYVKDDDAWIGSPFAWIKNRPSPSQRGTICEKLVSSFLEAKDFRVSRSTDSDADRVVDGLRVEIKSSTLWQNGGYKFQQLRDQNYDVAICLGISPFAAHCWVIPKSAIMEKWGTSELPIQHGGQRGNDTVWLSVDPDNVQGWLRPYGGTLDAAIDVLRRIA